MKMMFWKEWRENFKWAVLAMIGLGLAEFYGLTAQSNNYQDQSATLCKSSFLMATTFGCAAVGLVLGLIQILPEQRRDQWAALLHRPVSRSTIFCGKALAGTMLYLLATIPPFLAVVWYVATPGHFASPFVPQMVLPGIADICAGMMYYFAALFVGLRKGAWYGTRAFGFLAAVMVSSFVSMQYYPLFRVPVEASFLMVLTLFVAGWGAILTNGRLADQPWLTRLALVVVTFYGVCCLGSLAYSVLLMFTRNILYYGSQYIVDIDGRPLLLTNGPTGGSVVKDLAGNVINDKRFVSGSSYNYYLGFSQISQYIGDPHQIKSGDYSAGYRNNQTYVVTATGNFDFQAEHWYYLPLKRNFVGFYYKIYQRIGAIGQNGFKPGYEAVEPLPPVERLGYYYQLPLITRFANTVYRSDFDQRKLTPVFSQAGVPVFGGAPMSSNQDDVIGINWAAVALSDRMLIIDKTGETVATLPYHQDMDRLGAVSVAVMPDKQHFFLEYRPSEWIDSRTAGKMTSYLEEMNAKGNLLNSYALPPIKEQEGKTPWTYYLMASSHSPFFVFGELAYDKIGAWCGSERLAGVLNDTLGYRWGYFKDRAIWSSTLSMLLAVVALAWTRWMQFSWKRSLAWAVFVLGFNYAGLITLRLVADWPVRVGCPQCGGKRTVEEKTCPHCRAGWSKPAFSGIEIFEKQGEKVLVSERS